MNVDIRVMVGDNIYTVTKARQLIRRAELGVDVEGA